ncbi:MAG: M3 family metallopeptidase [Prevotellaceae bacterium]|nr:M3 family metallopeptidase [Prevotellaceae bacterium]
MAEHTNPFLRKHYDTPLDTVPFQEIRFEDYEEAFLEGMRRDDEDTEKIAASEEEPTFENTIIPKGDHTLERVSDVFFNLLSADTNDDMDALAQKMEPLLTQHANKQLENERLWLRIKAVHDHPNRTLDQEEQQLLDLTYEGFARQGALLSPEDKKRLGEMREELGMAELSFQQNELKEMNSFQLHITDRADLSGLPDSRIEAAALEAKEAGKEGWLFTLHGPSYGPFMTYADNRELRRRMYMAHGTMCTHEGERNNLPLVPKIVNLRRRIANILGYKTYADFALEKRMAEDTAHVYSLLRQLEEAYLPVAKMEVEEVCSLARRLEGDDFEMMPWDFAYYSHKLKLEKYDLDEETLRPYFELGQVKRGVFGLATRLYGITFHKRGDIQVFHPDAEAWEVDDKDGSLLGILYTDFHPRPSKQSGAWMTTYKEQWNDEEDGNSRPHASVTMNFSKPTEGKPALLTLGEVNTLLHEFGHSLHALFSQVRFEALSCTNVAWDFVELPSQIMENWTLEPEFLNTFAYHYETKEPMPQELIQRIERARHHLVAYSCVRQVGLALLDMAYYTLETDFEGPVREFEKRAWADCQLLPELEETCMTVQFSHIMTGGYAAGYYSYKWAEVLEADAFSLFKKNGIFDQKTAQSFRDNILSRGRTEPAMDLYKRFRGQEPSIGALLKRDGIKE